MGLLLLLLCIQVIAAAAAPTKWTVFIYMLADNDLEQYGLLDLEEVMVGMSAEPLAGCSNSPCNGACPANSIATYTSACTAADGSAGTMNRCCPGNSYPDVLLLVDRGSGLTTTMLYSDWEPHADYTPLTTQWTTAKEYLALPGGQWQMLKDHSELNMADPAVLSAFLQRGLQRFEPQDDGSRKYMLVFWDHGSGWFGYGADHTCSALQGYSQNTYCSILRVQSLARGLHDGLIHPRTHAPVKLDIIGFDACLMAMYEVASVLAPYTHTLLASELLEPGHGWDYSTPLQGIIETTTAQGVQQPDTGLSTKDVADLAISGYVTQAADWGTSGLTLALLDASGVHSQLESSMSQVTQGLQNMLNATAAFSMQVLQRRTALGDISGAEENVDLGALLQGLISSITQTTAVATSTKAALQAAKSVYDTLVVSYQRDNTLYDGTGMAIYFPSAAALFDAAPYTQLVGFDAAALSGWMGLLYSLYSATAAVAAASKGPFTFVEPYAVPYQDFASKAWITHGTLSSPLGLSADLMYGFITPTGTELIIAGNKAAVMDSANKVVIGSWSGLMFGLLQDLTGGDDAVDGLALTYADEQHVTDASGAMVQYVLQVQVYYASSCYDAVKDMKRGMIKYVLDMKTQQSTMQLFVSSSGSTGSWGEVPPAQGGVVIPYLGSILLTGATSTTKAGASFGYSDCLKWGYSDSLKMMAFNAAQAAGVLGLDLTRDMVTQLVVQSFDGNSTGITGFFQPVQKTLAGCQCSQRWDYQPDPSAPKTTLNGTCVTDAQGTWCTYEPGSCGNHTAPKTSTWDFCVPATTLSGCNCHPNWSYNGKTYHGTCASDGDPRGTWCVVDRATCPTAHRAHEFGGNSVIDANVNNAAANLTGLDFDYCQTTTISNCHCSSSWTYNNTVYNGICRAGLMPGLIIPGIEEDTQWCQVDMGCKAARSLDGYSYDTCSPSGGRVTVSGQHCQLPASYHGIMLYDCISYNHSTPGSVTSQPWCFIDAANGTWDYCQPWTCSEAVQEYCPSPAAALQLQDSSDLTGWGVPKCLEGLCDARQALVNISQCTEDSQDQRDLLVQQYTFLAASPAFGQLLQQSTGSGSLDAYCSSKYGELCVDYMIDPACPALFRVNNKWRTTNNTALLCQTECLQALCKLQEWSKADTTGTKRPAGAYSCADSELETLVRWVLMQQMDAYCMWPGPATLACNRLLSPPQLCAAETPVTNGSGQISDGSPEGGMYSASSVCSWTLSPADQPYITLNFTRFDTEHQYDMVTVEDFEGVIGMFSGNDPPPSLTTDTGLLRVNFTSDGTVQKRGFNATYLATTLPQTQLPTCTGNTKLLQAVLRSRQYGAELSWLITARNALGVNAPSQFNIVMAGGLLPASLKPRVPAVVAAAADGTYKDYRSYYSYACLPIGSYNLNLYDSYGDGWSGGRITLTLMVNATAGCQLLSASADKFNKTTGFAITNDADISSAACSSLTSSGSESTPYYIDLGLIFMSESTSTFILAKQHKIKEALALLLDMDTSQVSIQSIADASSAEVAAVSLWGNKTFDSHLAAGAPGSNSSEVGSTEPLGKRHLLEHAGPTVGNRLAIDHQGLSASVESNGSSGSSIDNRQPHILQQVGHIGIGKGLKMHLAKLAVPVSALAANGVLWEAHRQLQQAHKQLVYVSAAAAALTDSDEGDAHHPAETCIPHGVCGGESNEWCDATAACTDEGGAAVVPADRQDTAAAAAGATTPEESVVPTEGRKLQQLLVLNQQGQWQDAFMAAAAGQAISGPGVSSSSGSSTGGIPALLAADPLTATGANGSAVVAPRLAPLLQQRVPTVAAPLPKPGVAHAAAAAAAAKHVALASSFRTAFSPVSTNAEDGTDQIFVAAEAEGPADSTSTSAGSSDGSSVAQMDHQAAVTITGQEMLTDIAAIRPSRSLLPVQQGPAAPTVGAAAAATTTEPTSAGCSLPLSAPGTVVVSNDAFITEFDVIAPSRSLHQHHQDSGSSSSSNSYRRRARTIHKPGQSTNKNDKGRRGGGSRQGPGDGNRWAAPDVVVSAAADFVRAGKLGPGKRNRPVVPFKRLQAAGKGIAAGAADSSQQQGTFKLMGPKTAAHRKRTDQVQAAGAAVAARGAVSIPWQPQAPGAKPSSAGTWAPHSGSGSSDSGMPARQLLAASNASTAALLVVARVRGYRTQADADAAASSVQQLVTNGTLRSTLAAQGWSGVVVGLQFVETGRIPSRWSNNNQLRQIIIAAAVSGGVAFIAVLLAGWWVRRTQRRGAAQLPAGALAAPGAGAAGAGAGQARLSAIHTGRGGNAAAVGGGSCNSPRTSLLGPGAMPGSPGGSPYASPGGYAPLGSYSGAPTPGYPGYQVAYTTLPTAPFASMPAGSVNHCGLGRSRSNSPAPAGLMHCCNLPFAGYPAGMYGFQQQQVPICSSPRSSPCVGDQHLLLQQQQQQQCNSGDATVVIAARMAAVQNGSQPQQQEQQRHVEK